MLADDADDPTSHSLEYLAVRTIETGIRVTSRRATAALTPDAGAASTAGEGRS